MAIVGAHSIVYSKDAEADRAFLRDLIGLPHVDVGDGWLIFGLPPAEVAVHPGEANDVHEFYLMTDDVAAFVQQMQARSVACTPPQSLGWGVLTTVMLPGGGKLGVYEPHHARPQPATAPAAKKARAAKAKRPPARKARAAKAKRPPARKARAAKAKKLPRKTARRGKR